jgi:hypothetical protein
MLLCLLPFHAGCILGTSLVMPCCIYSHPNSLINSNPNYAREKSMTKNYISMATNEPSVEIHRFHTYMIVNSTSSIFSLALILRPAAINLQKDAYILHVHIKFYKKFHSCNVSARKCLWTNYRYVKSRCATAEIILIFLPCSKSIHPKPTDSNQIKIK